MKKLFFKIKSINKQLREVAHETEAVTRLPFYSIFKQEDERVKDMEVLNSYKRDLLNIKYAAFESLQIEIEKQKADVSSELQQLTLININHEA
jgi:hypothetical protein